MAHEHRSCKILIAKIWVEPLMFLRRTKCSQLYFCDADIIHEICKNFVLRKFPPILYASYTCFCCINVATSQDHMKTSYITKEHSNIQKLSLKNVIIHLNPKICFAVWCALNKLWLASLVVSSYQSIAYVYAHIAIRQVSLV